MKKETRVKDLPEILVKMFERFFSEPIRTHHLADYYFSKIDWTKATDAERLAYCEVRYIGKEVICLLDGKRYDNLNSRRQYCKNQIWLYGEVCGDKGWSVCVYEDGKFAEIIEDEVKEPKNEGCGHIINSMKETENEYYKQQIKEKLKGTCVLNEKEGMGAEIVKLYTEAGFENRYKQIGSTPNSYYGENEGTILCWATEVVFEKRITLDQLRAIVRGKQNEQLDMDKLMKHKDEVVAQFKAESVEFKEGEMVEVRFNGWPNDKWVDRKYLGVKNKYGKFVCESKDGGVNSFDEIRKIDPDADLKKIADEVLANSGFYFSNNIPGGIVKSMLIEAMKRVKK